MSKKSFIQAGFAAAALSTAAILNSATAATAVEVTVTIDNLSPEQGLVLTPFWVGFHAGDYDLYEFGEAASPELERIAEDGDPMPLREAFMSGDAARLDGVVTGEGISPESPPLIPPNTSATMTFELDETHQFFSYASMILPSNDGFIGNESGISYRLFDANGEFIGTDFVVIGSQILDAGTETNDEAAENVPLLGQTEPDTGMTEGGTIAKHPGVAAGGDVLMAFPNADFTQGLYPLARIRVELAE
ncbi:MAG: spondin domain-containing protein [Cyanobacteria bacterium J06649_5]